MTLGFHLILLSILLASCGEKKISQIEEEKNAAKGLNREENLNTGNRSKNSNASASNREIIIGAESGTGGDEAVPPTMVTASQLVASLSSCYLFKNKIYCTIVDSKLISEISDIIKLLDTGGNLIDRAKIQLEFASERLEISVVDQSEIGELYLQDSLVSVEKIPLDQVAILINSDSKLTNLQEVTLTLTSNSALEMYLTNTADCASGGVWEPFTESKEWLLAEENLENKVFAKFRYSFGLESDCIQDSIIHDNVPPSQNSFSINADAASTISTSVNLSIDAVGANEMYVTNIPECTGGGIWEAYSTSKEWELGQFNTIATVYIKYRDEAGNDSECYSDSINHDGIGPSVISMVINNSDNYTSSNFVNIQMNVSGASEMLISNTPNCIDGVWEDFSPEKSNWELIILNTLSFVYAKFRDSAGNESTCINDSITHDTISPSNPSNVDDGSYTVSSGTSTNITWQASTDTGSGVAFYEVSIGTSPGDASVLVWTNVGNVTTTILSNLSLNPGITYYVNVRATDRAGNMSNMSTSDGFEYNFCNSLDYPGSWVLVPGDSDYGTSDFCVMKYSARNDFGKPISIASGLPWRYITQSDAKSECNSLGNGFHLITNPEWMTLAANAAGVGANWSGGSVGNGQLAAGHSDGNPSTVCAANSDDSIAYVDGNCNGSTSGTFNQRRTHILSNGSILWDIGGNTYELVDYFNQNDKPSTVDYEYPSVIGTGTTPLRHLVPTNAVKSYWNDSWDSSEYIGAYWPGDNGFNGVMVRGADYNDTDWAGIFYSDFDIGTSEERDDTSFRCVIAVP